MRWSSGLLSLALATLTACSVVESVTRTRTRRLARVDVTPHDINLDDANLHYWVGGEGPETILFLHGFGGDALFQWYPQLRALARDYRVIAPDLLWFGHSNSSRPDYGVEHQAEAVLRLLEHEGVERFHLVGISYGGMVSHHVAARADDRVDRVVIVSSPARAFLMSDKDAVFEHFDVDDAPELLLPRDPDGVKRLMQLAYHDPPWVPKFVARQIVAYFYAPHREQQVAMLEAVEDSTAALRRDFGIPLQRTLIIWGEEDMVFPESAAWRLRGELGEAADICVLPEAAHAPHLERANEVIPMMRSFLADEPYTCPGRSGELQKTEAPGPADDAAHSPASG